MSSINLLKCLLFCFVYIFIYVFLPFIIITWAVPISLEVIAQFKASRHLKMIYLIYMF